MSVGEISQLFPLHFVMQIDEKGQELTDYDYITAFYFLPIF